MRTEPPFVNARICGGNHRSLQQREENSPQFTLFSRQSHIGVYRGSVASSSKQTTCDKTISSELLSILLSRQLRVLRFATASVCQTNSNGGSVVMGGRKMMTWFASRSDNARRSNNALKSIEKSLTDKIHENYSSCCFKRRMLLDHPICKQDEQFSVAH